ncbi:MAG: aminoacyl-tRNA hydrolase [Calditrichaceae bacterium]
MEVVFGLGNPGIRYRSTRHNIGFILLDYIKKDFIIPFRPGKGDYYFCELDLNGREILLVKPTTFMNNSGVAVRQVMEYFSVREDEILVVYDDFHLKFGTLRFRRTGSDGGHNGIKSIVASLETQNFGRLRIGIGGDFEDSIDFVLSSFSKDEQQKLEFVLKHAYDGIKIWLDEGIDRAMNTYNRNFLDANTN